MHTKAPVNHKNNSPITYLKGFGITGVTLSLNAMQATELASIAETLKHGQTLSEAQTMTLRKFLNVLTTEFAPKDIWNDYMEEKHFADSEKTQQETERLQKRMATESFLNDGPRVEGKINLTKYPENHV
jgi:hypothetical protein